MYDVKKLDYNGHLLRQINLLDGKPMWALHDICKILGYKSIAGHITRKLKNCNRQTVLVKSNDRFRGRRLIFIDKEGVKKLTADEQTADSFKNWFENEVFTGSSAVMENISSLSVQAGIQKAQMLIRIAEHKAVPKEEQLRLLRMAAQMLTDGGISNIATDDSDIMDLPEVVGFIRDKKTENVNGCMIDFLPANLMAYHWSEPNQRDLFSSESFNEIAEEYDYKTPQYGFWQRVTTPQGEAREFMYIEGTMLDYLRRRDFKKYFKKHLTKPC